MLVAAGANFTIRNNDGKTARDRALEEWRRTQNEDEKCSSLLITPTITAQIDSFLAKASAAAAAEQWADAVVNFTHALEVDPRNQDITNALLNAWAMGLPAVQNANAVAKKSQPAATGDLLNEWSQAYRSYDIVRCQELLNAGVGANDKEQLDTVSDSDSESDAYYLDTPLMDACRLSHGWKVVQLLIEHNADIDAQDKWVSSSPPTCRQ